MQPSRYNIAQKTGNAPEALPAATTTSEYTPVSGKKRLGVTIRLGRWHHFIPLTALIDVALVAALLLFFLADTWVVFFHLIFVVLAIGAFYWRFPTFGLRAGVAITIATLGMIGFYRTGTIAPEELTEIPMLALILLLVFIIARQRAKAQAGLELANQQLEQKVVERTAALQEEIEIRRETENRLRASEEQYVRLIDLSFDAVSITYLDDGSLAYVNRAGLQLIGATSLDEVQGRAVLDFAPPGRREAIQARLRQLLEEGRSTLPTETQIRRLDGRLIDVELMSIPIHYKGRPAAQSVYRDLSDRERLEAVCAEERLNIADQLHNSLGQSLSYLHLTLQDLADHLSVSDDQSSLYKTIAHTAEVANEAYGQVGGLLDELIPPRIPQLREALAEVATALGEKGGFETSILCQGQFRPLPFTLRKHILFICREALTNVAKHADAQHVVIELKWGEDTLRITITDDGRGFDPLAKSASSSFGLRIMEERVIQLNGVFLLKSTPGAGTEIMFQVPSP